jgi:hypothetical protein
MRLFSRPRPNGSRAEKDTSRQVQEWLKARHVPFRIHRFRLYPYFFECIGAWLIVSRLLLSAVIWLRWGWVAFPVALVGLIGATVDQAFHLPLVTWPGARQGENILIEFKPRNPRREILISAHYDSKTELLDHNQRMFFLKAIPWGIGLSIALSLLGPLDQVLLMQGSQWAAFTYRLGVVLSLPLLFLAGGLGINMLAGRFIRPSQGAVDNGAACAILLGLAKQYAQEREQSPVPESDPLGEAALTLALFTGEEVDRQGSRAYAAWRSNRSEHPLPDVVVNLEIMAQDGSYVYWKREGSIFRLEPTTEAINQVIQAAVLEITGSECVPGGPILSDGAPFLQRGIPTGILGTYDLRLRDRGFHRPDDNLERVVMDRLPEGTAILKRLIFLLSQPGAAAPQEPEKENRAVS